MPVRAALGSKKAHQAGLPHSILVQEYKKGTILSGWHLAALLPTTAGLRTSPSAIILLVADGQTSIYYILQINTLVNTLYAKLATSCQHKPAPPACLSSSWPPPSPPPGTSVPGRWQARPGQLPQARHRQQP